MTDFHFWDLSDIAWHIPQLCTLKFHKENQFKSCTWLIKKLINGSSYPLSQPLPTALPFSNIQDSLFCSNTPHHKGWDDSGHGPNNPTANSHDSLWKPLWLYFEIALVFKFFVFLLIENVFQRSWNSRQTNFSMLGHWKNTPDHIYLQKKIYFSA